MRILVSNRSTTTEDVDRSVAAVLRAASSYRVREVKGPETANVELRPFGSG